jgi:hypothetical protein
MKLPSIEPRSGTSKNKDPYGFAFSENMSDWSWKQSGSQEGEKARRRKQRLPPEVRVTDPKKETYSNLFFLPTTTT